MIALPFGRGLGEGSRHHPEPVRRLPRHGRPARDRPPRGPRREPRAWWANPAAASRSPGWPRSGCCRPPPAVAGSVQLDGQELLHAPPAVLDTVRGGRAAMIFQDPASALNPVHRIGRQVAEAVRLHRGLSGAAARAEALRLLDQVGIPGARARMDAYPHEMSGGQNQRVMIAAALAGQPGPADRRRADHRAGRDHPGADSGPAAAAARRHRVWRWC